MGRCAEANDGVDAGALRYQYSADSRAEIASDAGKRDVPFPGMFVMCSLHGFSLVGPHHMPGWMPPEGW